jgi:hypothetical protein
MQSCELTVSYVVRIIAIYMSIILIRDTLLTATGIFALVLLIFAFTSGQLLNLLRTQFPKYYQSIGSPLIAARSVNPRAFIGLNYLLGTLSKSAVPVGFPNDKHGRKLAARIHKLGPVLLLSFLLTASLLVCYAVAAPKPH